MIAAVKRSSLWSKEFTVKCDFAREVARTFKYLWCDATEEVLQKNWD